MKNIRFLFAPFCLLLTILIYAGCGKDPMLDEEPSDGNSNGNSNTNLPPTANFSFSPQNGIIADQTAVNFTNLSSGTISNYIWHFGTGETTAYTSNPSYTFDREGWKTIKLHVSGPAGSDIKEVQQVRVHAMDPNLYHYEYFSTQQEGHIQSLRGMGLNIGKLKIRNNYNNVSLKIRLYHPDSWLEGIYTPFANSYWNLNASQTINVWYNNAPIHVGNDWGIQFEASNGSKSAIRSLHYIASFQNGEFVVQASDLYEG